VALLAPEYRKRHYRRSLARDRAPQKMTMQLERPYARLVLAAGTDGR
jgi:hypothetical protein